MRVRLPLTLLLLLSARLAAQSDSRTIRLDIQADSAAFEPAAAEYRAIWSSEGSRMVAAMERFSGLTFQEARIPVRIVAGPSSSGYRDKPMRLRATYPEPTKRATLIHELGHRLQNDLFTKDEDDHPALFLWLYDAWAALYGSGFAKEQVEVESARTGGRHDYAGMWATALAKDSASRAAAWRELRDARLAGGD